jgi:DNA primase catalytic subunit
VLEKHRKAEEGLVGTKEEYSMSNYYSVHFPAEEVLRFSCLHHEEYPERREFVAVTATSVWRRYNSVRSGKELRELAVKAGVGASIHLGPYYNDAASRARGKGIVAKQLPFDLDLTDITFLGILKRDQATNDRFAPLVFGHAHVLRSVLHEVFGFEHFLPVYSGGRGVHLWCLDERANALTEDARRAICAMITPQKSMYDDCLYNSAAILTHPSFGKEVRTAMYDVLTRVLLPPIDEGGVGLFDSTLDVDVFLKRFFLESEKKKTNWHHIEIECEMHVRREMKRLRVCGPDAYTALKSIMHAGAEPQQGAYKMTPQNVSFKNMISKLDDVMFTLCWPTLDAGPTTSLQHPLKIPFSQHPSTKRIALPVDKLLPERGKSHLPPIVTATDLNSTGRGLDRFLLSVALMKSAVASARPSPKSSRDIEDLAGGPVARPKKAPKFK